ncbi:MAG: translocation/assembly module TamB domain-containing protein [Bacteroidales bacterium]|nr:translocation/assembly module TamB domain-containing protein [Bacteroidales bacterium]
MERKFYRTISMSVVILFTIGIISTGLLRNNVVQTYLARTAAIHLSKYLDAQVKIDRLSVSAFFTLKAKGIEINDLQNNPLIHLKSIYLSTNLFKAFKSGVAINMLDIDSANVFIREYTGEKNLNIVRLFRKFHNQEIGVEDSLAQSSSDFRLKVNQLDIHNSHFIYQIEENIKQSEFGINYSDIDLQALDISLRNISMFNDSLNMVIRHISAKEKSGFQIDHFEGDFIIFKEGMRLNYAFFEAPNSNLEFNLNFDYPNWTSYKHFVEEVSLSGEILEGQVNTNDIAFFAPVLEGMNNPFKLKGIISGPLRKLRMRNILLTLGYETSFAGSIQMTGLPNILETFINLRIRDFSTSIRDIQLFQLPGGYQLDQLPDVATSIGAINIKGNFTGFYNDFVSNADFYTNIGQLATDVQFSNNAERDIIEYKGDFQARHFNLGSFLDKKEYFGNADFDLNVKGEGLDMEHLYANVQGKINSFQFKDKQFDDIGINGLFQEKQFTGDISINDELIRADFQGHIYFDTLVPNFDFELKLDQTHLALLGLLPVDSSAVLATDIKLNFSGNTIDNIRGEIGLDSTILFYKDKRYWMQALKIRTSSDQDNYRTISLNSDFIDGDIRGEFLLSEMKNTGRLFLNNYLPNIISNLQLDSALYTKNMNWDIRFKDLSTILPLIHESLQVSENGFWNGNFDAEMNVLNSQINFPNAIYHGIKIDSLKLNINNKNHVLNADLLANALIFKEEQEEDTLQFSIDNFRFSTLSIHDSIQFLVDWKNKFKSIRNKGDIAGYVSISQMPSIDIKLKKVDLIINDTAWYINPENRFRINENGLIFEKVGFYSGSQLVELMGGLDPQNRQDFRINFNNFNISNSDILLNYKGIDLDGLINGEIQFINIFNNVDFLANLRVSDLKVNKELIGNVLLNSKRNLDKSIFINADIEKILEDNQIQKPLVFEGFYFPNKTENSLDFSLFLNKLPIQVISPFLYKLADHLEGDISGNVLIGGQIDKTDLKGNIKFNNVGFRVIYLNTEYKLNANAEIDNYFIDFRDAVLRDEMDNQAPVYGGLFHDHLTNFGVDLSVWPQEFMGLNTRKGMNSLFYGKAFVNGSLDINGLFNDVGMEIYVEASKGSEMVIPINLTADISENEFITFVNHSKDKTDKPVIKKITEPSKFSLNMELSLTPDASVDLILPGDLGNIQAKGMGNLNLNMNRAGNFTMAGDYRISEGTFLFTIKNVYKKRFDLVDGGSISWTGDPYTGMLNMKAVYHVKTSLNTLGAIQDTSFRSRVPVDCVIGLSDQILNPHVKFGFEFPNSSEEVRQSVFSQIDTTNEAEMSQQMLSLLVLNSFSFASATGNDDFASNVGGSSLQLVANQLGNWLSQISNDLDVGIKYRPGGAITNKEVEVALSTQLFDERVTVDGNFGYQNLDNISNSNTSNIVGDINVEVKITKDGRFRLKAFNRTNTVDLFDNIAPYTQGVGVFYRKEFNFVNELFKRKKQQKPGTEVEPKKIVPDAVEKARATNTISGKYRKPSQ